MPCTINLAVCHVMFDPRYFGFSPTEFVDRFRDQKKNEAKNPDIPSAKVRTFRCEEEARFYLEQAEEEALFYAYPRPMPEIRKS